MITHRVVDVVKPLAGWEAVVGINVFKPTNGQEHSNRRAESKKGMRVESQLWVINGHLWGQCETKNVSVIRRQIILFMEMEIGEHFSGAQWFYIKTTFQAIKTIAREYDSRYGGDQGYDHSCRTG